MQNSVLLQIANPAVLETMLTMKQSMLAVTLFGDNYSCEAVSEQQESQAVKLVKNVNKKTWNNEASATNRGRVASFVHVQEVHSEHQAKDGVAGRQAPITATQRDKEQRHLKGMLGAARLVLHSIREVGVELHVAGEPAMPLTKPASLFWSVQAAKNKFSTATEAQVQGIKAGVIVGFPSWHSAVPQRVAIIKSSKDSQAEAKAQKVAEKAHSRDILQATMEACNSIFLSSSLDMLTNGDVGDNKAEIARRRTCRLLDALRAQHFGSFQELGRQQWPASAEGSAHCAFKRRPEARAARPPRTATAPVAVHWCRDGRPIDCWCECTSNVPRT